MIFKKITLIFLKMAELLSMAPQDCGKLWNRMNRKRGRMQFRNTFVLSVSQFLGEPSPTDYRTEMNRVLWQIKHEHFINRGYVYSSNFISDDDALEEFRRKNPSLATEPRIVKFRSGRYVRN